MLHVEDLQIEAELMPLFNFTHNAEAEAALLHLLQELPPTVDLVQAKQAVFQGFLANWEVLADFSYSKIQLREVQRFLADVSSGRVILPTNQAKASLQLLFSEEARYQTRARYVQVIQFLHRLQQHYFHRLNPQAFPSNYRSQLLLIGRFLERFSLESNARVIVEDAFSVARMVQVARQLQAISEEDLTTFWGAFNRFEAYWSAAKGMRNLGFTFPQFREEGLQLDEFYHPLVQQPVVNTLVLAPTENVVLLTGPNMSGKSTLLKAVGLCVYFAHAGMGVPAARCELPFFESIVVAINLRDSLRDGYSHFMAEIQNLKTVLQAAHSQGRTFAIFDELFRGTNVDDALEITSATLNGLANFPRSTFLLSTHLLQLNSHLSTKATIRTCYIDCVLRQGIPVFSYQLKSGWSQVKIGKVLFEQEGLHNLLQSREPIVEIGDAE
jgi:DNA mismatch repair protein MutS